jgi:hypothetical protein
MLPISFKGIDNIMNQNATHDSIKRFFKSTLRKLLKNLHYILLLGLEKSFLGCIFTLLDCNTPNNFNKCRGVTTLQDNNKTKAIEI